MQHNRELQKQILMTLHHRMVEGSWNSVPSLDLCKALGIPRNSVTIQCNLLEREGYIETRPESEKGRPDNNGFAVETITPEGHDYLNELEKQDAWWPFVTREQLREAGDFARAVNPLIGWAIAAIEAVILLWSWLS